MRRRRALEVTACVAAAALVLTGGIVIFVRPDTSATADIATHGVKTSTVTVDRGDLRGTTTQNGTLAGTKGASISGGTAGTLTDVPSLGTVLKPGNELYRVDDLPIVFFAGGLPQWRPFEQGMSAGPDVTQLEHNLAAWGYFAGTPNGRFDWRTKVAVMAWQKHAGLPVTGTLEKGRIWFGLGEQVVSARTAKVGDTVSSGSPVYTTTGTTKVVTVQLPIGSPLAKVGGVVEMILPNGVTASGRVTAVGDPKTDDEGKTTMPLTVGFDDQKKAGSLDGVEVSVDFVSETRRDVLSVPVIALGAKAGGGFVVEVVGADGATKRVPVEVGLFAGDRVEITSGAVKAGDRVVVPV